MRHALGRCVSRPRRFLKAGAVGARGMLDPAKRRGQASNEPPIDLAKPEGPRLRDAIAPIDSLRDRTRGVGVRENLPPIDLSSYQMALKQLQSFGLPCDAKICSLCG